MASSAGFQPMPYFTVYAASKAFVLSFSEALWAENRNYNVSIVAVCPGPSATSFFADADFPSFLAKAAEFNSTPPEVIVREAIDALENKHSTVIPGDIRNQVLVNIPRFLPREALVNLWKTILGTGVKKN